MIHARGVKHSTCIVRPRINRMSEADWDTPHKDKTSKRQAYQATLIHTPVLPCFCSVARHRLWNVVSQRGYSVDQMLSRINRRVHRLEWGAEPFSKIFWIVSSWRLPLPRLDLFDIDICCQSFCTIFVWCALEHVSLPWCMESFSPECCWVIETLWICSDISG